MDKSPQTDKLLTAILDAVKEGNGRLEKKIGGLETKVGGVETQLYDFVGFVKAQFEKVEKRFEKIEKSHVILAKEVHESAKRLKTMETDVLAIKEDTDEISSNFKQLTYRVAGHERRITHLERA